MDHVTLPWNNYHPPLAIPYICGNGALEYDHKGFIGFPRRIGVVPEDIVQGKFDGLSELDALNFFQSWCFFGLLFEFLTIVGRAFTIEDFLQRERSAPSAGLTGRFISTWKLPVLFRQLEEESRTLDTAEKVKRFGAIRDSLRVAAEFTYLSSTYKIDADGRHFFSDDSINWATASSLGNLVHPSVLALGELLETMTAALYTARCSTYSVHSHRGLSTFIQSRMVQAGWCPSQVRALYDQKVGVTVMYYLSSMNSHTLGWCHDGCGDRFRCQFDTVDLSKYKTKHSLECQAIGENNCHFINPESTWSPHISGIVRRHQTPLITVHEHGVHRTVQICVKAAEISLAQPRKYIGSQLVDKCTTIIGLRTGSWWLNVIETRYVCISHVWADGLGNPRVNSIPACQFMRLQRMVNELYPREESPVPFWLDTLCVPISRRFRRMAIVNMAQIYRRADKVLVLDSSLLQASTTVSPPLELHVRLMTSRWSHRLWKFHEAILAEQLYYQFADRALTSGQLLDIWLRSLLNCRQPDSSGRCEALDHLTPIHDEARKVGLRILSSDPVARKAFSWLFDLERFTGMRKNPDAAFMRVALNALFWRTTSWPGDEAICLAGLLDLDIGLRQFLAKTDAAESLKILFVSLESVPLDILFANLPRSRDLGFSWVPSTILGRGRDAIMTSALSAYPTPEGLRFTCPGFRLRGKVEPFFDDNRVYLEYNGHYYYMVPRAKNHIFEWKYLESLDLTVILHKPLVYPDVIFTALIAVQETVDDELQCVYLYPTGSPVAMSNH